MYNEWNIDKNYDSTGFSLAENNIYKFRSSIHNYQNHMTWQLPKLTEWYFVNYLKGHGVFSVTLNTKFPIVFSICSIRTRWIKHTNAILCPCTVLALLFLGIPSKGLFCFKTKRQKWNTIKFCLRFWHSNGFNI